MSRYYEMAFEVNTADLTEEEIDKVKDEIEELWGIDTDDMSCFGNTLEASGNNFLCGGESEDEFARRAVRQIWETLGDFVKIEVRATFLEELPFESYEFDEDDYEEWKDPE